ncbi:hypothetical protein IV203_022881 [Nitzschia inconspicua]|uniref:Ubiquitin-like domain-containing protein n=1 Tax=Nitzschia inconspicua TaxID=303405 RepID=A0A9K3PBK3_9STRA|nr:hypothetical protein IV203_022881 [Nitzschia inconspicua]
MFSMTCLMVLPLLLLVEVIVVSSSRHTSRTTTPVRNLQVPSNKAVWGIGTKAVLTKETDSSSSSSSSSLLVLSTRGGSSTAATAVEEENIAVVDAVEDENHDGSVVDTDTVSSATTTTYHPAATADNDDDDDEEDGKDTDDDDSTSPPSNSNDNNIMNTPVKIIFTTNLRNPILDQTMETTTLRKRTFAELRNTVSKRLIGKPPVVAIQFMYRGKLLRDDMLVDEIFDHDDDDDEQDDDNKNANDDDVDSDDDEAMDSRIVTLNIVPPVDERFAVELTPKLLSRDELDAMTTTLVDETQILSTYDLLEAYFLNQACLARNAQLLMDPNTAATTTTATTSSTLLPIELQDQAKRLQEEWKSQLSPDVWESTVMAPIITSSSTKDGKDMLANIKEEWKGQRYRSGKGGVVVQLKQTLQTNFNVDWVEAIRTFVLFIVFGLFGGKSALSKSLLIFGGPYPSCYKHDI